ncbi:MAG: glutaredoxin 3 [Cycloclasticus sp.]|nr:glutaredoxin 3 [Cycloclasticus sp.]MBQ0788992.1 glutaredoxin 3 [Cycloclasticus sp.]
MPKISLYTTAYCPYCTHAKRLLDSKNINYVEISVDNSPELRAEMEAKSQRRTVPQIFNGDKHIGDCMEIYDFESSGKLSALLA